MAKGPQLHFFPQAGQTQIWLADRSQARKDDPIMRILLGQEEWERIVDQQQAQWELEDAMIETYGLLGWG